MKRRVEINIEIYQLLRLRLRANVTLDWCPQCGEQTEMIKLKLPPEAASLHLKGAWFESGKFHISEPADGTTLVCLRSWSAATTNLSAVREDTV
jgi:hypothetical protein